MTPPPAVGEGTWRQWPMRVGFHVPQRQSSRPVVGSWPLMASPPTTRSSARPLWTKGRGVLKSLALTKT